MIHLTRQERDRFAAWCEWEAEVDGGLAEQMEKLNIPAVLVDRKKMTAAAKALIAAELRSIEEQVIGG